MSSLWSLCKVDHVTPLWRQNQKNGAISYYILIARMTNRIKIILDLTLYNLMKNFTEHERCIHKREHTIEIKILVLN